MSVESEFCINQMTANLSCSLFFSSTMSPLSSCFRVASRHNQNAVVHICFIVNYCQYQLLFFDVQQLLMQCYTFLHFQVEPEQFLVMCERSQCDAGDGSRSSVCKLALAYIQLCNRNYVPLELPIQCG